ncbi:MAG: ribonuclease III [Actinomycetota bacterium]|nr:ribonuclease III [Actinomycetota bacterium]
MSLETRLGHTFGNPDLLRLALTHRSVSSENPSRNDNERLEFLGDAVLQLVVTDVLYESFPHLAEGQLAKIRAAVVSRPALAEIARSVDLGSFVELAPGEERTGGREKNSILADAFEAILGAVYLDSGLDAARQTILRYWTEPIAERAKAPGVKDYKTRLQEHLAAEAKRPDYRVDGMGPDHDREFVATVSVEGRTLGRGGGRSKKAAEQAAAEVALQALTRDRQ